MEFICQIPENVNSKLKDMCDMCCWLHQTDIELTDCYCLLICLHSLLFVFSAIAVNRSREIQNCKCLILFSGTPCALINIMSVDSIREKVEVNKIHAFLRALIRHW